MGGTTELSIVSIGTGTKNIDEPVIVIPSYFRGLVLEQAYGSRSLAIFRVDGLTMQANESGFESELPIHQIIISKWLLNCTELRGIMQYEPDLSS